MYYMASVAKDCRQVTTVDQEILKIKTEMLKLERERGLYRVENKRQLVAYRLARCSKKLRLYVVENGILKSSWNRHIQMLDAQITKSRERDLREKVLKYRAKEIEIENRNRNEKVGSEHKFWKHNKGHCYICDGVTHRMADCRYKFKDVLKRMLQDEEKLKSVKEMAKLGCTEALEVGENKKIKVIIPGQEEFFKKYEQAFYQEGSEIKFCKLEKCAIETKKGTRVMKKGCMIAQALYEATEKYIKDLEKRKIIRRSESNWRNPIRAIQKPNGMIRLVSNFMALNDLCSKDPYELQTISKVISMTQGFSYFSVLDLKEGYYSIEIVEEHKHKTAFEFDGKVYEWNAMVMGYKNAPQIMQRVVNKVLEEFIGHGVAVYMDDIIVAGKTRVEHDKLLGMVLKRLGENNLRVNRDKVQFAQGEVTVLGVKINGLTQTPNEEKRNEAILYPQPRNLKELRRFLGLAGWFRAFVPKFAMLTVKLTDSLKNCTSEWRWTEAMDAEFVQLKKALSEMSSRHIIDYSKQLVLKTDASNVGLGAVLLQDVNGVMKPIQWASKKLTPAETRYGISEKEMLAVYWGIKKFEYELRGRKFLLITDHKALEYIREKPNYENNRINRWIEKIQEFDFNVEYQKPEMLVGPDALSRIYETDTKEKDDEKRQKHAKRILEGKIEKHVLVENGEKFWINDNGLKRRMPEQEEWKNLILNAHKETNHRGLESTYYALKDKFYWIGMKKCIEEELKRCETCNIVNFKKTGGSDFVETKRPLEKVAMDIIDLGNEGGYVLIAIDYFTRYALAKQIERKNAETILSVVQNWCQNNKPEEIITDHGKEFVNAEFKKYCNNEEIQHRVTSVESHRSNGRVERIIRTVREGIMKSNEPILADKIKDTIRKYNRTYHTGIKMTPLQAMKSQGIELLEANSRYGSYARQYSKGVREVFQVNQTVRIAKNENLGTNMKGKKGRFVEEGEIIEVFEGDSYLVRKKDGKFVKKRHYDLKAKVVDESMRLPSQGGDVMSYD